MTKSSPNIHPTAIIDRGAKVQAACKIGPYCVIGPDVEVGEHCRLVSHVALEGSARIGSDKAFFAFCSTGMARQDLTYGGEPTRLEVGDRSVVREFVAIDRG